MADYTLLCGDAIEQLRTLPDRSVQCCVTSPPYYGLRDYGTGTWEGGDPECDHLGEPFRTSANINKNWDGGADVKNAAKKQPFKSLCGKCGATRKDQQIGLETTPQDYVAHLVAVFREVRRVLRDDGVLWLNLGDSYASSGGPGTQGRAGQRADRTFTASKTSQKGWGDAKAKDLLGIPWMVSFALRDDGWYLRQDIVWHKPNPMPESVTDRCTKSHEYLFVLTKSPTYYWDSFAMQEDAVYPAGTRGAKGSAARAEIAGVNARPPEYKVYSGKRNRRSVWSIATRPFKGAHFATFPRELIEPCILATSSDGGACSACGAPRFRVASRGAISPLVDASILDRFGTGKAGVHRKVGGSYQKWLDANPLQTRDWKPSCSCGAPTIPCAVLDPFAGSGTTASVALKHGRNAILIELSPKYATLATHRIARETKPEGSLPYALAGLYFALDRLNATLARINP